MTLLAAVLTLVLSAIALLHAYWGVGGVWPGADAASCARTVGGFPGVNNMPGPGPCFAVAAALAVAALLAAAEGGLLPRPSALLDIATLGAAFVFLGRGIAGFTPGWRRLTPEQPFATLDVRYYSPLCLAIGTGLAMLAIRGFSA